MWYEVFRGRGMRYSVGVVLGIPWVWYEVFRGCGMRYFMGVV